MQCQNTTGVFRQTDGGFVKECQVKTALGQAKTSLLAGSDARESQQERGKDRLGWKKNKATSQEGRGVPKLTGALWGQFTGGVTGEGSLPCMAVNRSRVRNKKNWGGSCKKERDTKNQNSPEQTGSHLVGQQKEK